MTAVKNVTDALQPAVAELVAYLESSCQSQALSFFQQVQQRLHHVEKEDELLELFMLLSMTAFQGFRMDPTAAMLADRILGYAQQIADTFSADDDAVH